MMLPPNSTRLFDADQVQAAYDDLASRLNDSLPDKEVMLLPVMTGGLFAAVELARRVRRPLQIDYVHASRYRGQTRGAKIQWLRWPELPHESRTILLVDDIFDEGYTLQAIRDRLQGHCQVVTAVLVRKQHARGLPRDWVDHHALEVPDRYVFGCGMDYREYFRELPEIWALPNELDGKSDDSDRF
ncbi:MAG: hypoxanthine-guanine phosphoribosyltransferase [Xanthomonadaceae bacterium]|nr:hypoxanthine-guanine phosphoribosyltransferase [Xanthomonadaceae bacterium]